MNKSDYIEYLKGTLIPDLLESGSIATAFDFAVAVSFMQGKSEIEGYYEASESEMIKYCKNICNN